MFYDFHTMKLPMAIAPPKYKIYHHQVFHFLSVTYIFSVHPMFRIVNCILKIHTLSCDCFILCTDMGLLFFLYGVSVPDFSFYSFYSYHFARRTSLLMNIPQRTFRLVWVKSCCSEDQELIVAEIVVSYDGV